MPAVPKIPTSGDHHDKPENGISPLQKGSLKQHVVKPGSPQGYKPLGDVTNFFHVTDVKSAAKVRATRIRINAPLNKSRRAKAATPTRPHDLIRAQKKGGGELKDMGRESKKSSNTLLEKTAEKADQVADENLYIALADTMQKDMREAEDMTIEAHPFIGISQEVTVEPENIDDASTSKNLREDRLIRSLSKHLKSEKFFIEKLKNFQIFIAEQQRKGLIYQKDFLTLSKNLDKMILLGQKTVSALEKALRRGTPREKLKACARVYDSQDSKVYLRILNRDLSFHQDLFRRNDKKDFLKIVHSIEQRRQDHLAIASQVQYYR